jgi:hypothetical protein
MRALRLLLLADLPLDEVDDLGVVHVETDHLRGAPRGAARLGRARGAVEHLEEAHEARARAAARELLLPPAEALKFVPVPEPYLKSRASVFTRS